MVMCRFGGYREGDTHDPIPNSTVKPLRAYDTMTQVMGKSVAAKSTHYHTLFYFLSCFILIPYKYFTKETFVKKSLTCMLGY